MLKPRRSRSRRTSFIWELALIFITFWQAADSTQLSRPQHMVDDPRCQGEWSAPCASSFRLPEKIRRHRRRRQLFERFQDVRGAGCPENLALPPSNPYGNEVKCPHHCVAVIMPYTSLRIFQRGDNDMDRHKHPVRAPRLIARKFADGPPRQGAEAVG